MNDPQKAKTLSDMTLMEHLTELRKRFIWILIYLILGGIAAYSYSDIVFNLLTKPYFDYFPPNSLIGTGPAEPFILKIKVAVFVGAIAMCPLMFHQIWLFISPGMHDHEKGLVFPFIFFTTILFVTGVICCYQFILPVSFAFFKSQYDSVGITPQIRISEHLSMMIHTLLGFGLIFETPVLTFFLAKLGFITHLTLIKGIRYAIVIIFIVAAVLTPTPDIMNQFLFAVPLMGLYVISIAIAYFVGRTKPIEPQTST